jgi:HEAT repeat protein
MQHRVILIAAVLSLAGCFQAQAPPPATPPPPGTAARDADDPVLQVMRLGEKPGEATMSTLTTIVRSDTDPAVRQEAVYVMADIGSEADAATIAEALRDPDEGVRIAAVEVLSTMDGETPKALLAGALQDSSPQVRLRAVDAFGDIDGPAATLALQQALADPDAGIREAAAELIEERTAGRQ